MDLKEVLMFEREPTDQSWVELLLSLGVIALTT